MLAPHSIWVVVLALHTVAGLSGKPLPRARQTSCNLAGIGCDEEGRCGILLAIAPRSRVTGISAALTSTSALPTISRESLRHPMRRAPQTDSIARGRYQNATTPPSVAYLEF